MKVSVIFDDKVNDSKGGLLSHVDDWCEFDTLAEFGELATMVHIAPAIFRENRKRQDHLESIQFIAFDFDDGRLSADDIHKQLKHKLNHVILGSKSCFIDKGDGKGAIERFHVFIPTDRPVTDVTLYKFICKKVADLQLWSADKNCMEPSRYFYKHTGIMRIYDTAQPLEVSRFERLKEIEEQKSLQNPIHFFSNETSSLEQFRQTKYFEPFTNGNFKNDGERYSKSCSVIGTMLKMGLSEIEIMSLFDEYSIYGKSFTRASIVRRIKDWK